MTDEPIPQWAIERAKALSTAVLREECPTGEILSGSFDGRNPCATAFARYIASKEEAPVDPLTAKVGEAFAEIWDSNEYGTKEQWAEAMQAQLAKRGLEIREVQP